MAPKKNLLQSLDYSVLQQCMHCGMCLPTCPTYTATGRERNSPRGRISLMKAIADGEMETTRAFGEEMYYCLGCLACMTACPAGVDYAKLFETARAHVEAHEVLKNPRREAIRNVVLRGLFTRPRALRAVGRLLWIYQATGMQTAFRKLGLTRLLPGRLRQLEPQTPTIQRHFSDALIKPVESARGEKRYRVALLTGCVQDLMYSNINRATMEVLVENGCEVVTPRSQYCCGSLHAHNGDLESARKLARRQIDMIPPEDYDAIISNAGGCGSHLMHYDHLLSEDPIYAERAKEWSRKLKDVHRWLAEIGIRKPKGVVSSSVTYHESCHLCHGQKVSREPRDLLKSIPGLELRECAESQWCCGSAGIYTITQPEMATKLQKRKVGHLRDTGAAIVATANPGCHLQIKNGFHADGGPEPEVMHPMELLARAYREERE